MELDAILGIDQDDSRDRLADYIVSHDEKLIEDLVARRRELRMSQEAVAERMGINKSNVCRIERGDRDLMQSTLRRYAMAIDAVVVHEVRAFEDIDSAHKARRYYETDMEAATRPSGRETAVEGITKRELVVAGVDRAVNYGH